MNDQIPAHIFFLNSVTESHVLTYVDTWGDILKPNKCVLLNDNADITWFLVFLFCFLIEKPQCDIQLLNNRLLVS